MCKYKKKELASRRSLQNLTVGPVLTVSTDTILSHTKKLLQIDGAKLLWGGEELSNHSIPKQYGMCFMQLSTILFQFYFF